jgi:hypothetical protein
VKANLLLATFLALICTVATRGAEPGDVKDVLEKFQSIRPKAAELALYQLDWTPTLKAAREKAAKEERPIFLVMVTNSFGDMFSGHC